MIKFLRNFWIELNIDGRQNSICSGPRRKDGGFEITINQRNLNEKETPIKIYGKSIGNSIELSIRNAKGEEIYNYITER